MDNQMEQQPTPTTGTNSGIPNHNLENASPPSPVAEEKPSFVKLAMRNMVKKGGTSLFHFFLTVMGVLGALLGLAIAFH
jgi:hypothetical protein